MATYGGGIQFTSFQTNLDFAGGTVQAVYAVPAGNNYVDFNPLSMRRLTSTGSIASTVTCGVQKDDGAGGWISTGAFDFTSSSLGVTAGNTAVFGLSANGEKSIRIYPGERIIVNDGSAGGTVRLTFTLIVYSPST